MTANNAAVPALPKDPPPVSVRTERPTPPVVSKTGKIVVKLVGNTAAEDPSMVNGIVSFAVPFPPGVLNDAMAIGVQDAVGKDVPVFTEELLRWRIDNKPGSIRSVLVQFADGLAAGQEKLVTVTYGTTSDASPRRPALVPVEKTLVSVAGSTGPQVWALLPAKWMCESWVVGPQIPASENKFFPEYDAAMERSFGYQTMKVMSVKAEDDNWLFDRTTTNYKMYVRTGELKYLKVAYHCANYVRNLSRADGSFGTKLMYCYPRAQGIHYMFTGDERAMDLIKRQTSFFASQSTEAVVTYVPGGKMWTERIMAYSWAGLVYPFEWTGGAEQWSRMKMYADVLYNHQTHNPDGLGFDGSWGHRWDQHDPDEAHYDRGASAWMTALMVDAMFEYWFDSGDQRVPEMIVRWCDFLIKHGLTPDGKEAYYVINCLGPSEVTPGMTRHSTEISYVLAMGIYFSKDPAQQQRFYEKFKTLYSAGTSRTYINAARSFNWSFQNSSALMWLLAQSGITLEDPAARNAQAAIAAANANAESFAKPPVSGTRNIATRPR